MSEDRSATSRDEIYAAILSRGLLMIRNAGWSGDAEACAIEADHLHNVPELIGQSDEARHRYYLDVSRNAYIGTLTELNSSMLDAQEIIQGYAPFWEKLERWSA